jgi:hypothetical protein
MYDSRRAGAGDSNFGFQVEHRSYLSFVSKGGLELLSKPLIRVGVFLLPAPIPSYVPTCRATNRLWALDTHFRTEIRACFTVERIGRYLRMQVGSERQRTATLPVIRSAMRLTIAWHMETVKELVDTKSRT